MKVDIEVHLFEPATGVRGVERANRWGHEGDDNYTTESIIFWWQDGNGGCDCNRGMSLDRATTGLRCTAECESQGGAEIPDCRHYPCSGRDIIIERLVVNGETVYSESEPRQPIPLKDEPDQ